MVQCCIKWFGLMLGIRGWMVQCWVEMMVVLWRPKTNCWPKTALVGTTKKVITRERRIGTPTKTNLAGMMNWQPNKLWMQIGMDTMVACFKLLCCSAPLKSGTILLLCRQKGMDCSMLGGNDGCSVEAQN